MNKGEIKLGIVIVTWNNEKEISDCIDSILRQNFTKCKILLVDNDSSDKTVSIVKDKFPQVEIIALEENIFLTGGNNKGIEFLREKYNPEYLMVLNPDTYLFDGMIQSLISRISEDQSIGAIGPKVVFWNNKNEGKINSTGIIYDGYMQAYDRGFLEEDEGQYDSEEFAPAVTGACIIYRASVLNKVGLYDTRIKLYLDELELSIRIKKAGYKILYYPKAKLGHNYMASTLANKNIDREKQKQGAWLTIALKHYPIIRKLSVLKKVLLGKSKV